MRYCLALALFVSAPAAQAATRDWPVAGFDRIDLAAAASVEVRTGARFALHAEGDPDLVARLDPIVRGGTLELRWKPGGDRISRGDRRLHLIVAMPRIAGATISGAGTVVLGRVEGPSFDASVSGAGELRAPIVQVGLARLTVGGAGSIKAAGQARRVDIRVAGVGEVAAPALRASAGSFALTGTGSVTAYVDGPAEGSLSGMGSLKIIGNPRCAIRRSGWGSVSCGR